MKRLLADLTTWILAGRIHHRQASACRALVQAWIGVDEHQRLDSLEKRIEQLRFFESERARGFEITRISIEEQEEAGARRLQEDLSMQRREGYIREPSSSET